jgi:hypothetical protein
MSKRKTRRLEKSKVIKLNSERYDDRINVKSVHKTMATPRSPSSVGLSFSRLSSQSSIRIYRYLST